MTMVVNCYSFISNMSKTILESKDKRMKLVIYESTRGIVMADFTSPGYHDVWHCYSRHEAERRWNRIVMNVRTAPVFGGFI